MTSKPPFRRWRRWPFTIVAALAAALLVVAAYQLSTDASGDPIHDAVAGGDTLPAPPLDLPVLTAGDLGGAPRRFP